MKKTILFALAMFFFSTISNAQLRFGVKAGTNLSHFASASSVVDQVKGATNYQFGVLFQAKAFGFAIQPEILYSVKSGQFSNTKASDVISGTDIEYQSNNIEIPVNLQFGLGMGPARIFVQGGPYVSFLTSALVNGSVDNYDRIKENMNTFDYGVGAGVGAEIMNLQLTVKYDWGLSKLGKESMLAGENVNPFNELQNRNLSISLAYLF